MTGFVERLVEKWHRAYKDSPMLLHEIIQAAINDTLTEAARVAEAKGAEFHRLAGEHFGTEGERLFMAQVAAAQEITNQIKRLKDE